LDQWEFSIYSEAPEVFVISNKVLRTSSSLLPPLAPPLLRPLLLCRRCQRRFPGHVLCLGRSPAPPPAPSYSTRRPQPERRSSFSSLALARAPRRPAALLPPAHRRRGIACACPLALFSLVQEQHRFPLFPFHSCSCSLFARNPEHHRRHLLRLRHPSARRGQPTAALPAPPQPPGKFPRTPLTLTSQLPRPDLHRSYLVAVRPFAGKLLPPSSSCLRPSSAQFDYSNSFLSSSCSCSAQASSSSSPGTSSPTSAPSAAASVTVGKLLPVIPSPSQDLQQVCLDLLVLADHSSSHPHLSPRRNLAGNLTTLLPRRARGIPVRISKVLRVSL
jgi:hypothetical protein